VRECHPISRAREVIVTDVDLPPSPPGANTDRPDAHYRPARQKNVNPGDPPDGYYDASEPPLRTLVLRRFRKISDAIRRSRNT